MKQLLIALTALIALASCEGGVFKKKNCKSCETITYGQTGQVNQNKQTVCGDDDVSAYISANSFTTSSVTVVTTCK